MSLKLKLISLISAFMLVLGMLLFGVFAATNVTIQMGGSLSFIATDVYAKVTGAITGAGVGNQTLPTIEFSASNETPDQSGWQNLDLEFNTAGDPITIEVTVENLASDRNLTVNLQDNFSSQQGVLVKEVRNGSSTYTGADVVLNASTGAGTSTTTFIITLSLSSKNNSLPDTEFGYTINLYDASYELPEYEEITGFSFSTNDDGTATVASYIGTDTNVVVPDSLSIVTIDTGVAGYTKTFNNMDEFTAYMNNGANETIMMAGFYYMTTPLTERTFVTNYENYFAELYTLAGNDPTKLFPMTIETTDYEITYENFTSLGEVAQYGIIKPLYDVMFGNVGGVTMEFNSGEKYDIDATNAMEIVNEIMSSLTESSFPIKISYSSLKTMYIEGDDYVVTSIGMGVFSNDTALTSITLPSSLTSIGENAFYNCVGLTGELVIPEGVTSIGNYAFSDCSGLTSITLPSSLTSIGDSAFYQCSGLTSIDLSGCTSLTSIGDSAFCWCTSLTSITLPNSLTSIGDWAFSSCSGLGTITVEAGNTVYHSAGNCLIETASGTLVRGCNNSVIPQDGSVTSIGSFAFSSCSRLINVTLPSSLTSIGASAFYNCSRLTSITFNTPYSWEISSSSSFSSIDATLTASQVQINVLDYLTSTYYYYNYYWRAVVE